MDEADDVLVATEACVFDAYGTLFDVHSAVAREGAALGQLQPALSELWRRKQLEYSWLRSLMGVHRDFWTITGDALDHAMEHHGVTDPPLRARLVEAYLTLDAYPEVPATLAMLRRHGRRLAILSNGTPAMLDAAVAHAGLEGAFDAVLSVESVGTFKPTPVVYRLAVDRLGLAAERICFLSSNGWDVHGAAAFGFPAVWVNRTDQPAERLPGGPRRTIPDLGALPSLVGLG